MHSCTADPGDVGPVYPGLPCRVQTTACPPMDHWSACAASVSERGFPPPLGFALKCSTPDVGDRWRDVLKDPIADARKRSKAGA